ncbi:SDR family NAD(P)-dependent oxidoreductase [Streptomyces sp. NPDC002144]
MQSQGPGPSVVMAVRDVVKGHRAAAGINGETTVQELDLSSLASVRAAAEALHDRLPKIDLLINNAGVVYAPQQTTRDGFELQVGTNHLGHFALTGLLLDLLLPVPGSRVVTLGSSTAGWIGAGPLLDRDAVRSGRSVAALEELAEAAPAWLAPLIEPEWAKRYGRRVEIGKLPGGKAAVTARAEEFGRDGQKILTAAWAASTPPHLRLLPQVAEWADLVCSTGPAGTITLGGSNPTELPTKTIEYDRWGNTAKTTETANSVTRTTTNTYDTAGRLKTTAALQTRR